MSQTDDRRIGESVANVAQRPARRARRAAESARRRPRPEREMQEVVDRERRRLGRELHDGLCQRLAGIAALGSTLARKLASSADAGASAAAAEISRLLHDAIGEARDLARALGPADLDGAGLAGALATLAGNVGQWFDVGCTFACDRPLDGLGQLDREVETHLFRIAQEGVHNAVTHGQARRIEIHLGHADAGEGLLFVRDDGVGLPEHLHEPEGIGLRTMDYRARRIAGSLTVRPRRGRGTVVCCRFPIPANADCRHGEGRG